MPRLSLLSITPLNTCLRGGDRRTLEREADAIIAMATAPARRTVCPSCRTENDSSVRFCRVCGTPISQLASPPEVALMRLSAQASAAQVELTVGLVSQLLTLANTLPMIFFGPNGVIQVGWVFFVIGELMSVLALVQGIHRLRSAVNTGPEQQMQPDTTQAISIGARASLMPQPFSVTEGTTELMNREKAPVLTPGVKDTDPIE
jgi:hypothetical protein